MKIIITLMISCVLLSAGYSSRFGSPKALAVIDGETVIERIQKVLLNSAIKEIIVVLGSESERIEPFVLNHKRVKVVYNKDHNFGQTSSFKCGLENVSKEANGVMLLPVDYPFIDSDCIDVIVHEFEKIDALVVVPRCNNVKGHPPLFDISLKDEFLSLSNDTGLNSVGRKYQEKIVFLDVENAGVIDSFNTKEEFELLKEAFILRQQQQP